MNFEQFTYEEWSQRVPNSLGKHMCKISLDENEKFIKTNG